MTFHRGAAVRWGACLILVAAPAMSAQAPAPDSSAAARRADLARFRTEVLEAEKAFTPEARMAARDRLRRLEGAADTVSPVYLELELARIVALVDNGHSMAFAAPRARRYNRIPLRLAPFGTDFYVLRGASAHADLLGARLVAIDGRDLADLRSLARSLAGGTDGWRDRTAAYFLESPQQLHALGVARAADAATYRFVLTNGQTVERSIDAEPPVAGRNLLGGARVLYPGAGATGNDGWFTLLAAERAPWVLQEPGAFFRARLAPEVDGMVVELRQTRDAPGLPIRRFLDSMTTEIRRHQPRHLVLDMRMNGGGDLNTARDFMRSLPGLVPGRIFVLTSPWTFSAAISSVGYLEQAAPDRVTIVGEMVGDRLEFWAEGPVVILPNVGAEILISTERHDYRNGCRAYRDCHGSVVRHPISVPSLAPDIAAPWTIEAYRAGRDPAMEAVAAATSPVPSPLLPAGSGPLRPPR